MLRKPHWYTVASTLGVLVLLSLSGCAGAAGAASSAQLGGDSSVSPSVPDGTAVQPAVTAFRVFADREAGGTPFTVQFDLTSASAAEQKLYSQDSPQKGSAAVSAVVLVAEGQFSGVDEKVPAGISPTPGRYLTEVVNLSTGAVMDWGLTDDDPDISSLGTPSRA